MPLLLATALKLSLRVVAIMSSCCCRWVIGGSTTISGATGIGITGGQGGPNAGSTVTSSVIGGAGGNSSLGGAGASGYQGSAGTAAAANSGSGGGGAGVGMIASGVSGCGGGAGGYIDAIITSPAATYSYAVGAGGTAGGAGTSGNAGGAGAAGIILVTEYYQ